VVDAQSRRAASRVSVPVVAPMAAAAGLAAVAQITRSKSSDQPSPASAQADAWLCRAVTRVPSRTRAPRWRQAASGSSAPRSSRGSSRAEADQRPKPWPNSASRMTVRNTCALAWAAGRFRADTHSGSISSSITRAGKVRHSPPTVSDGEQTKPERCQASEARTRASRSDQRQPRAVRIAATASSGAGQRSAQAGVCRPLPSG
jgi:hypothetical protein